MSRRFHSDERSASIAITHAMTLGITAILITSLLLSTGDFLQSQQERVAQKQLQDVGADVASLIDEADELNATGNEVTANLSASYPSTVGGEPYTIALVPDGGATRATSATLYLNASELGLSVSVPIETDTPMEESRVRGNNPTVRLCVETLTGQQVIVLGRCPP